MKKLMIVMAAVAMVGAANAEATWLIRNAGVYNDYKIFAYVGCETVATRSDFETTALDGFNAMYMNESTAWAATGAKSWSEHYKTISEDLVLSTIADGVAAGTFPKFDELRTVSFLLCKDGVKAGGEYLLTEALYDERIFVSGANEFDFTNVAALQSGTFMIDENIPEPTSAMLMLLGTAGLALRRRRA